MFLRGEKNFSKNFGIRGNARDYSVKLRRIHKQTNLRTRALQWVKYKILDSSAKCAILDEHEDVENSTGVYLRKLHALVSLKHPHNTLPAVPVRCPAILKTQRGNRSMTDISTGTLSVELEKSLQNAPTTHPELLAWVRDVAALTEPTVSTGLMVPKRNTTDSPKSWSMQVPLYA